VPASSGQRRTRGSRWASSRRRGRRFRIRHQDGAGEGGAQLPGGLPPGPGQNPILHPAGLLIGQHPGGVGDQSGLGPVDDAATQRAGGAGQPDGQVQGQLLGRAGGPAGQRQRRRDLVGHELAQLDRELTGRGGRCPVGGTAAGQLGDRGQQAGGAPGLQPLPGPQHANQLVIVQLGQPSVAGGGISQPSQWRAGCAGVQNAAGLKSRTTGRWDRRGAGPESRRQTLVDGAPVPFSVDPIEQFPDR
jgi:hypothetical protein